MSVPEPFRTPSAVKFLSNFHLMRKEIDLLLMRDFGLKPRNYDVDLLKNIYNITPEDTQVLLVLSQKYGMKTFSVEKYPEWMIYLWRNSISEIMNDIGRNIELGNSIKIDGILYEDKYRNRSAYFEAAIGNCNVLKDKFHEIVLCTDAKLGNYEEISKMLKKEIDLLKGVKRNDRDVYYSVKSQYAERIELPDGADANILYPKQIGAQERYFAGSNINGLRNRPEGTFENLPYFLDCIKLHNTIRQTLSIYLPETNAIVISFKRTLQLFKTVKIGKWKIASE